MLVRLDPRQKATTVLSIPRDLHGRRSPATGARRSTTPTRSAARSSRSRRSAALTGLKIHHVVNVNFKGFRSAINLFDCFYVDVDRRYFHSNSGVPISQRYDAIDIQPGYQRLCGIDALDYVRFRHADTDLVRAARQQDFLRAAKDQISHEPRSSTTSSKLGQITAKATQTDKRAADEVGLPAASPSSRCSPPTTRSASSTSPPRSPRRRSASRRSTTSRPTPARSPRSSTASCTAAAPTRRRSLRKKSQGRAPQARQRPRGEPRPRARRGREAHARRGLARDHAQGRAADPLPLAPAAERPLRRAAAHLRPARPGRHAAPRVPVRPGRTTASTGSSMVFRARRGATRRCSRNPSARAEGQGPAARALPVGQPPTLRRLAHRPAPRTGSPTR